MERYVADAVALLNALGLTRVAFWGFSDGAQVGYALAAAHPERVVALIASGTIGDADRTTSGERAAASELAQRVHSEGYSQKSRRVRFVTFCSILSA